MTASKRKPNKGGRPKTIVSKPAPPKPAYKRNGKDADALLTLKREDHFRKVNAVLKQSLQPLSPVIIDSLVVALERGHHPIAAINSLGVSQRRFARWMKQGMKDGSDYELMIDQGVELKPEDMSYEYQLVVRLVQANFVFEDAMLGFMLGAEDWKANLELLKRRFPDRWGDLSKVAVETQVAVTHVFSAPREASLEEWEAEQKRIEKGTHFIDVDEVKDEKDER